MTPTNKAELMQDCVLSIGKAEAGQYVENNCLFLKIDDVEGTYALPYIQSQRTLAIRVAYKHDSHTDIKLQLKLNDDIIAEKQLSAGTNASYSSAPPGPA